MIPPPPVRGPAGVLSLSRRGLGRRFLRLSQPEAVVIGVTGTAGKTSTVYLIAKMLSAAAIRPASLRPPSFSDGDKEWLNDKKMTMPGRFFIQKSLKRMLDNSCRYAIIETTSEGVKQFRHRFINYDILAFTGLYPEHIESHGSFEKLRRPRGNYSLIKEMRA
jgi:UDP-N-acetylmuramoyl-L-alanyl-D-glutamate--2,6-diaminopimelate ligase